MSSSPVIWSRRVGSAALVLIALSACGNSATTLRRGSASAWGCLEEFVTVEMKEDEYTVKGCGHAVVGRKVGETSRTVKLSPWETTYEEGFGDYRKRVTEVRHYTLTFTDSEFDHEDTGPAVDAAAALDAYTELDSRGEWVIRSELLERGALGAELETLCGSRGLHARYRSLSADECTAVFPTFPRNAYERSVGAPIVRGATSSMWGSCMQVGTCPGAPRR